MVKFVGLLVGLALFSSTPLRTAEAQESPLELFPMRVDLGHFSRYNSNFFNAQKKDQNVFLHTVSGKIAVDLMDDESTLAGAFKLSHTFVVGASKADWFRIEPTLNYKFDRNGLSLGYFHIPRQRSSDDPDAAGAIRKVNGFSLGFSRRWDRQIRTRLGYQLDFQDFSQSSSRDSDIHRVRGDIRYRFSKLFPPGIGFDLALRRSGAGRSYNQGGPVLLLESRIRKMIRADLRYRFRFRSYTTEDRTSSKFDGDDKKHDVRLRVRYKLTDNWSPYLSISFKDNDSSRTTRSYNTTEAGLGIVYRFP